MGGRRPGRRRRRGIPDQQRVHLSRRRPRNRVWDRRGRGRRGGSRGRRPAGGEPPGVREIPPVEERPPRFGTIPARAPLHEERASLRRLPADVTRNRGALIHGGRQREGAPRGHRLARGGRGGGPEVEAPPRSPAGGPIDVSPADSNARPLRILVCIKQVPKAQELQVDPVTQTLKRVGVPSEINPPDANALEIALTLKDRHAAEVVVLSMGPTSFDESLERAVAMGADRAVLLTDRILGGSDTVPTAYALSETIQKIGGYDLILTGEETTDASTGHVGPGIAGHLDLPQITYVSEVRIVDGTVRARRTAEDGTEWWQTAMPSLCTVNFGCNKPRSPTLTGKIRVKRGGVIAHWSCADVGIDPKKVGLLNSPTIVAKVDTIRLPPRAGHIFSGEPKETVRALLEALIRDRVIAP
ncbi:MAG: electron transfer flavoprotein subunit beta/FixA family protein [Methanobacteriota archaeon]|nr:MAG: electron transfer flavoprotein subunit beta/FixA family protein [Euryarchaeota archaeon]